MVRRHASVLLLVAALAALAVLLHPCAVASETRSGAVPAAIAPRDTQTGSTSVEALRATTPAQALRRTLRGGPWISPRTG
jgi:hypothetical protein